MMVQACHSLVDSLDNHNKRGLTLKCWVIGQKVLLLMPIELVKYWLYRHFIFLSNFYI